MHHSSHELFLISRKDVLLCVVSFVLSVVDSVAHDVTNVFLGPLPF